MTLHDMVVVSTVLADSIKNTLAFLKRKTYGGLKILVRLMVDTVIIMNVVAAEVFKHRGVDLGVA